MNQSIHREMLPMRLDCPLMFPFNDIKNHIIVALAECRPFAMAVQEVHPLDSRKNF